MGACNIEHIVVTDNLQNTYDEIVDQDRHDNGHSYSGTIGCSKGYQLVSDAPEHETEAYRLWYDEKLSSHDKWEPLICHEITGAAGERIKVERGIKGKPNHKVYCLFGFVPE